MAIQSYGIAVTMAQHRACLFLARHGQRFLVDFGTDNAIEKAKALRRKWAL
jgi:hypothetical protein